MNFRDIDLRLCNLCGTCIGICPTGAIEFDSDKEKLIFHSEKCINCGLCYDNCQGIRVDFSKLNENFFRERDPELGPYIDTYVGHSENPSIRKKGTSGGLVTQLLIHLLESRKVDGVIIPVVDDRRGWLFKPKIVTNTKEVEENFGSKYTFIPMNIILKELKNKKGNYAIVSLACQIHALRKLQNEGNREAMKIKYILGLICGHNMHYEATEYAMKKAGVNREDVARINYREYGGWPGGISFHLKSGGFRGLNFFNYHYMNIIFLSRRCRYCYDFFSEYADISFGDIWLEELLDRDAEKKGNLGWSSIITRTYKGESLLRSAEKKGLVELRKVDKNKIISSFLFNIKYKKRGIFTRLRFALVKPEYTGLYKPEIKTKEKLFHFWYNILLISGSSKLVKWLIRIIPETVLLKTISNFKKIVGYKPNARDKVLKHEKF